MVFKLIPVAAESLCRDFELLRTKAKAEETENPKQKADSLCADHFDSSNLGKGQHDGPYDQPC